MSRKIRLIIISILVFLFFVFSLFLILYSNGYRFDFEEKRIVKTGGLNVKISPSGAEVYLNNKLVGKTTILFNSVFVQNLLPKKYKVTVKKDGYFPWEKILEINEQKVTKAENITLFPEKGNFTLLEGKIEDFSSQIDLKDSNKLFFIKNNILYKQDSQKEPQKILKNLLTFIVSNNNIFWLSGEGLLIKSDFNGKILEVLNKTPYQIKKEVKYLIKILPRETIFLAEGKNLFYLDKEKGIFEEFFDNFNDLKISPDSKKILIFSSHEIWLSDLEGEKIFLNRFSENIGDCFWLNSYYLIFNAENKIKIIEVDNRDKPNLYDLELKLSEKGETLEIESPKIFFNEINKKLYLQTKGDLYSSEPLL